MERMTIDTHTPTESERPVEIESTQPHELNQTKARRDLGDRTVTLLRLHDMDATAEPLDTSDDPTPTEGTEKMTIKQEGIQNAELFKSTYDTAVESIDDALRGNIDELSSKIPGILSSIDALRSTPYIASAPVFVAMVEAARCGVALGNSLTAQESEDAYTSFASVLSQARHQLAGTLIAYRPR